MEKKYIIAVVAVVVLWAAFMGFRHFNKKDANQAHREDTYRRLVDMAQKSPRSGLYEMADAIRRYHADNKVYPPNLGALYPKYMPSKAFIEQIDWSYEPGRDNFDLSKATNFNNQTMVASIDRTMRPEVESSGVMVATRKVTPRKAPEEAAGEGPELLQEAISADMILEVVAEREMTLKEVDVVTAAVSPELRRGDRPKITEEKVNVQTELSRIVTLVGEEAVSAQDAQIGYNLERYMVWKDLNGAIGVSNVEFPDRTDMYVAVKNRWYNVKRRQPEGVTEIAQTQAAVVEKQKSIEEIAAGFSRNYLVWKSGGGVIGFGDTQYPDKERLLVASQGGWSALERPAVSETVAAESVAAVSSSAQVDINSIAADISRQYLVWKNKDGSLGIGDTQYPEREHLEVASTGGWDVITEEPLAEKRKRASTAPPEAEKKSDEKLLAAGISNQYLMWKDKNGQIGFSNVEYPELRNIAYVHTNGNWQKVVN
ncbi:MAG: hypothetical protein P1P89_12510 [Desulfobacterales bacterium]|nr:hypothetical protein [Desulfobacterales bacterium]